MNLTYLSICSGVEAATQAWHPLGWKPWAFAEIDPFPSYVLNHHYGSGRPHFMPDPDAPDLTPKERKKRKADIAGVRKLERTAFGGNSVPNLGDMTQFQEWPDAVFDVLAGGTPCQSYSVAGLRKGLDDPRGDLMLTYVAIARRYRPRWVAWENVPGVLSDDGGRSFGTLLGLLTGRRVEVPAGGWETAGVIPGHESAYGIAWRIVDSQFVRVDGFGRAVPQRRRRVFVVGYLGDWRRAAAVLFEWESLSGNPAPRRRPGQSLATAIANCLGGSSQSGGFRTTDLDNQGAFIPEIAPTMSESAGHARPGDNIQSVGYLIPEIANPLTARMFKGVNTTADEGQTMIGEAFAFKPSHFTRGKDGAPAEVFLPLSADADKGDQDALICYAPDVADPLVANEQRTYSHSGNNPRARNVVAFDCKATSPGGEADLSPPLRAMNNPNSHLNGGGQVVIAFDTTQITHPENRSNPQPDGPCHPLASHGHPPAVAFQPRFARNGRGAPDEVAAALTGEAGRTGKGDSAQCVALRQESSWRVRRLTPTECERLQGMADGYTNVPWRGKETAPDGPRYKALGNSQSVNVMRWLGRRIEMVEAVMESFRIHEPV